MAATKSGCDERCDELDLTERIRFAEVLRSEYEEIHARRRQCGSTAADGGRPRAIRALALSGGGIRSATFNLGLLQALNAAGKLPGFDYLSTVSGGGYVGGWWSAWLARRDQGTGIFPGPECIETDRDERRAEMEAAAVRDQYERPQINDNAITAGSDPIHHLRLFSNFLTPSKGLLSGDTWRAITVITRNLILTWLTLLPIMLAVIMGGQSWFALSSPTARGFLWRPDLSEYVTSEHESGVIPAEESAVPVKERDAGDLTTRLGWALLLPALLLVGGIVAVALWMVANRQCWTLRDIAAVTVSGLGWTILTWFLFEVFTIEVRPEFPIALVVWFVIFFVVLATWQHRHQATAADVDFWRSRLVVLQTNTLKFAVFIALVLLFAAFGHEFMDFLLFNQKLKNEVLSSVARAGGWGAMGLAALTSAYTAMKASPTGGEDASAKKQAMPLVQRIIFAIAPPLLLVVLGLVLAWVGHRLYTTVYTDTDEQIWFVVRGTLISGFLFLVLALYEFRPPQKWKSLIVIAIWLAISIGQYYLPVDLIEPHLVSIGVFSAVIAAVALAVRALVTRKMWVVFAAAAVAAAAVWLVRHFAHTGIVFVLQRSHVPQLVVGGILCTVTLLVFELAAGRGANTRAVVLMLLAFLMFVLLGVGACGGNAAWRTLAMVGLISLLMGWVLALGWLADPNALTIHGFYKARLIRAYMGASNDRRGETGQADITDAIPGDDVPLVDLRNTERGAPYHLVNTTLNLVGGRDLATQQRFSDSFIMSKRYCGSIRTGFRPTDEYACGTISLGTAVSVSGAAASPNMGSQTPSAALAALLTLFNIRLGYWAPTPNRSYWRSASARLWPFYTLQELLSQTTDLLPFCYLTDGGHFDNSGVYSLVQRGCNFIVYSDCGADPKVTLDDIGNLIRKVRIDFGTEIAIDVSGFRSDPPATHFAVGTIQYSAAHADAIGLAPDERSGTLVVVKPNRTAGATADVLQYGYTNATYPQQTTADQWYDEAQFESYRKLGQLSGEAMIAAAVIPW